MNTESCPGMLALTAHACGATEPALWDHLTRCKHCQTALRRIQDERAEFLRLHPVAPPQVISRAKRPVWYAVAAAVVLCLGATVAVRQAVAPNNEWRSKGGEGVTLYVLGADGAQVRSSAVYAPGERIQFTYSCSQQSMFMLMSIDSSGALSVYYPSATDSSVRLECGQNKPLANSIELDQYLGPEVYIAVFSKRPLARRKVEQAVLDAHRSAAGLAQMSVAVPGATVYLTRIEKRAAP